MAKFIYFMIMLLCIGVVSAEYCYQESATVSNQTSIDGSCNLSYSGSWGTYAKYIAMTYTLPTGALSDSLWQVKISGEPIQNLSIPASCWDYALLINSLELRLSSDSYFPAPTTYASAECYNGTDWNILLEYSKSWGYIDTIFMSTSVVVDGDWGTYACWNSDFTHWLYVDGVNCQNAGLYEEGMWWDMPSVVSIPARGVADSSISEKHSVEITVQSMIPISTQATVSQPSALLRFWSWFRGLFG
jgi:hypothetical protein